MVGCSGRPSWKIRFIMSDRKKNTHGKSWIVTSLLNLLHSIVQKCKMKKESRSAGCTCVVMGAVSGPSCLSTEQCHLATGYKSDFKTVKHWRELLLHVVTAHYHHSVSYRWILRCPVQMLSLAVVLTFSSSNQRASLCVFIPSLLTVYHHRLTTQQPSIEQEQMISKNINQNIWTGCP